jgi:magnesium-transporting ATPase (P-type)
MDTLAAFALCSEAPHRGLMKHKPVSHDAKIVTPFMWLSIIVTGTFLIIAGLIQIATGFLGGTTPAEINSVFFAAFIIAAVWNGINCRALDGKMPPFFRGNPVFFIVMGVVVLIQILIVQYGGAVFATVPLSSVQWVTIIIASASVLVIGFVLRVSFGFFCRTRAVITE